MLNFIVYKDWNYPNGVAVWRLEDARGNNYENWVRYPRQFNLELQLTDEQAKELMERRQWELIQAEMYGSAPERIEPTVGRASGSGRTSAFREEDVDAADL